MLNDCISSTELRDIDMLVTAAARLPAMHCLVTSLPCHAAPLPCQAACTNHNYRQTQGLPRLVNDTRIFLTGVCCTCRSPTLLASSTTFHESYSDTSLDMESPYWPGNTLNLRHLQTSHILDVRIVHMYEPFTLSVVLRVEVINEPLPCFNVKQHEVVIVKLLDRRFSTDMRDQENAATYTTELDQEYLEDLCKDPPVEGEEFGIEEDTELSTGGQRGLEEVDKEDDEGQETPDAWAEHNLQELCMRFFHNEMTVYERLKPLQARGKVPRYLCSTELLLDKPIQVPDDVPKQHHKRIEDYLRISAAVIEYVQGREIRHIDQFMPKKLWKRTILDACSIINEISDHDVLNEDVRMDNVLIQCIPRTDKDAESFDYQPVVLDFGKARLRRPCETDEQWRIEKAMQDEEGCIGCNMFHKLKLGSWGIGPGSLRYSGPERFEEGLSQEVMEELNRESLRQHYAMLEAVEGECNDVDGQVSSQGELGM